MILTLTPNPAIDLTYQVDSLRPGQTHRVGTARVRAGGKGLNVARVIHQQGYPTLTVSTAGGETGREFEAELAASGLPYRLVAVASATRRTIAITDRAGGGSTLFNEPGGSLTAAEWRMLRDGVQSLLPEANCLVASGSLPPDTPPGFYGSLVATAKRLGIPTIIDTTGEGMLEAAAAGADILKPNREELRAATGEEDIIDAAKALLERGAGLVLVSLGEHGMVAVSPASRPWRAHLEQPIAGNPTGAGDAAVAAAATALIDGITDPLAILRRATAWSAAAVPMPLAGEISARHDEFLQQLILDRG